MRRKIVKKVPVQYPLVLKMKGIGGTVRLKVFIKPDGSVRDTEVLGGSAILAESAQKSVSQWKFSPGNSETIMEISVVFDPAAKSETRFRRRRLAWLALFGLQPLPDGPGSFP